jgi:hypothetical protein
MLTILGPCCACALLAVSAENVPKPAQRQKDAGQRYAQTN